MGQHFHFMALPHRIGSLDQDGGGRTGGEGGLRGGQVEMVGGETSGDGPVGHVGERDRGSHGPGAEEDLGAGGELQRLAKEPL